MLLAVAVIWSSWATPHLLALHSPTSPIPPPTSTCAVYFLLALRCTEYLRSLFPRISFIAVKKARGRTRGGAGRGAGQGRKRKFTALTTLFRIVEAASWRRHHGGVGVAVAGDVESSRRPRRNRRRSGNRSGTAAAAASEKKRATKNVPWGNI